MKKILVLHDEGRIREGISHALKGSFYLKFCRSVAEARSDKRSFDLYICGQMGPYSDGLILALDLKERGKEVVVLGRKKKFSKLPFIPEHSVWNIPQLRQKVLEVLAGN